MSKTLTFANIAALLAISCALLYFSYNNGNRIDYLARQVSSINDGAKAADARREIQNFLTLNSVPYSRALCSSENNEASSALCKTLVLKHFSNLSNSTDLWVALDAITLFADLPNIPTALRREITRYYSDLIVALDVDGALSFVSRNDDIKYMISANNLYQAIMAQSVVCKTFPAYRKCQNGLTIQASSALKSLSDIVIQNGPTMAPFEMSNRMGSLKSLYSSGVLSSSM